MAKRNPGLESADKLIPKSMAALGEKVDRLYRTHYALSHLPDLIGDVFAKHIHPLGVRNQKLFVHVPEDAWRNEIWMYREEIIARINQCAGEQIVREIVSTRQGNVKSLNSGEKAASDNQEMPLRETKSSRRRELGQVNLTEEEIQELQGSCTHVENQELKKGLYSLSIKRKKLEKLRMLKKWHPCSGCGVLCPPEDRLCLSCASQARQEVSRKIRELLWDLPWLRYPEIKKTIPCTPEMVKSIRDDMVQRLAVRVLPEDEDSLNAHTLVMLYLGIPPERMTEELLKKTLYRLRHDLAKPKEFKPFKRYDRISWGKKKKGTGFDVSASGK